ncbi:MAG: hypothetical protein R2830_12765 [Saprospiraceae bacterium]|nr:hypothetical protein [Saprospiraceae bacterium]
MNQVLFSETEPYDEALPIIEDPRYYQVDVSFLKSHQSPSTIDQIIVKYPSENFNVRAIVGISSGNLQMTRNGEYVILPCPPYCEKNAVTPPKNRNPSGSTTITFNAALTEFP